MSRRDGWRRSLLRKRRRRRKREMEVKEKNEKKKTLTGTDSSLSQLFRFIFLVVHFGPKICFHSRLVFRVLSRVFRLSRFNPFNESSLNPLSFSLPIQGCQGGNISGGKPLRVPSHWCYPTYVVLLTLDCQLALLHYIFIILRKKKKKKKKKQKKKWKKKKKKEKKKKK